MVEHVGVVVDPHATADEAKQRHRHRQPCRCAQPHACLANAITPCVASAAYPEQCRKHQQYDGATGPVEVEPECSLQEMPEAVHVRIRSLRCGAVVVQILFPVQQAETDLCHQPDNGQQIAEKLVVRDHLQEQRQHSQQHERNRVQCQRAQIKAGFDMRVAMAKLPHDADRSAYQQKRHDHRDQGAELCSQRYPVRQWKRVAYFGRTLAALAPHQFTGIESDDDVQQPLVAATNVFQYLMRDWIG